MAQNFTDIEWPGWEVVAKLGEGSFGGVYEIQRTLPDGTVEHAALKKLTIPQDPTEITDLYDQRYDSESITAHFKEQMQDLVREYSFMRKLGNNPYVVHCQDLRAVQHKDSIGWDIYIRMELLKPLKAWLNDQYDEDAVIRLGLNICGALNDCHQKNIIHRDIKPENILVSEEKTFKLADFGIAKVSDKTATGTLIGTYSYMAPEIANRKHYGTSADIYSLGMVMYWIMNDRVLPFLPLGKKIPSGAQRQEAQERRFSGEEIPAPLNGSPELKRIVLKACTFLPENRYHSVQELSEELEALCYPAVQSQAGINTEQARKRSDSEDLDEETVASVSPKPESPKPAQEKPKSQKTEQAKPKRMLLKWLVFAAAVGLAIMLGMAMCTRDINIADEPVHLDVKQTTPTEAPVPVETSAKQTVPTEVHVPAETSAKQTVPTEMPVPVINTATSPSKEPIEVHVMAATENLSGIAVDARSDQFFWGQTKYKRRAVKTVSFQSTLEDVPSNAWDVSEARNRTVLAWMEGSSNLHIAANGKIAPNPNASWMFASFVNLKVINLGDCFDTSKVTDMRSMFYGCNSLTSLDISGFDTSRVTDMRSMFYGCSSLTNLNVSDFDTSKVTNLGYMFYDCNSLTSLDVSGFDTSKVTDMSGMFRECGVTSLDVSEFDTSKVTDMSGMFRECGSLTSLDVSGFDTSKVASMRLMFYGCSSLTSLNVSRFDTSKVTDMGGMFWECSDLTNLDVSGFDTSKVADMASMFSVCSSLTSLDVSGFDTSKVTDMSEMFYGCSNLTSLDVSGFDTSKVTNMGYMFYNCCSLISLDVSGFDTSKVTDMGQMFDSCSSLTNLQCTDSKILAEYETVFPTEVHVMAAAEDLSKMDYNVRSAQFFWGQTTYKRRDITTVSFQRTLEGVPSNAWDVSEAKDNTILAWIDSGNLHVAANGKIAPNPNASWMFAYFINLREIDFGDCFDTSTVTDMSLMFYDCSSLACLDLSSFDTSTVTGMGSMFNGCSSLTSLDVSGFDTSKVANMHRMFMGCSGLTSLNLSGFDTASVTYMDYMFYDCSSLTRLDLSGFNTSRVKNMRGMFYDCSSLTSLDVSGFDTSNVTNMSNMFIGCKSLTNLKCTDSKILAEYETVFPAQIVSISAGQYHTVGVRSDGSVVACGMNTEGQCDVTDWTEIVAIATGYRHTIGVKSDGTVCACGLSDEGQCNVGTWEDIVSVSAGVLHTVGMKRDGTAIAVGYNSEGECDVGSWNNLISVSAGGFHTVGLRSDGTVVATGRNTDGQCEVSSWRNICAVAAGAYSTVGLKTDGTIVVVGDYDHYGSNIAEWRNVIKISVNGFNTIAITGDGSVYAEGFSFDYTGECNVNGWHDLVAVASGEYHVVGLLGDGTVIATGQNDFGQCDVSQWK